MLLLEQNIVKTAHLPSSLLKVDIQDKLQWPVVQNISTNKKATANQKKQKQSQDNKSKTKCKIANTETQQQNQNTLNKQGRFLVNITCLLLIEHMTITRKKVLQLFCLLSTWPIKKYLMLSL